MAVKRNKLQMELDKPKKNWSEIQKLITKGNYNYSKLFLDYKDVKFRKLVIELRFSHLNILDFDVLKELKKSIYKESLEKYLSDGRKCFVYHAIHKELIVLINHHKINVAPSIINSLSSYSNEIYKNEKDIVEYLKTNLREVTEKTLHIVINEIDNNSLCEVLDNFLRKLKLNQSLDTLKELTSKITFKEYVDWMLNKTNKERKVVYNITQSDLIHTLYFSPIVVNLFPANDIISTFINTNMRIIIYNNGSSDIKKINLTKKQSQILISKSDFSNISNMFSFEMTEENFIDFFLESDKPEQYNDKVNELIMSGRAKELRKFRGWDKMTLTKETATILYNTFRNSKFRKEYRNDNNCARFSFHHYKKYLTQEELDNIINKKKELVLHINERCKQFRIELPELKGKDETKDCSCHCDYKSSYTTKMKRFTTCNSVMSNIVRKYELPFSFVVTLLDGHKFVNYDHIENYLNDYVMRILYSM